MLKIKIKIVFCLRFFKNTNIEILPTSSITAAALTSSASNSNTKLFASAKTRESLLKAKEFIQKKIIDEQKIVIKFFQN